MKSSTKVWFAAAVFTISAYASQKYHIEVVASVLFSQAALIVLLHFSFRRMSYFVFLVFLVCFAFWRVQPWLNSIQSAKDLIGQDVTILGRVITDRLYEQRGQSEFEIDNLMLEHDGEDIKLKGKLRVSGYGILSLLRHDEVRVTGKFKKGFGTRIGTVTFANIEVLGRSNSPIESFRRQASAELLSSFTEQQAALVLGILVGQRSTLSDDSQNNLRAAGLTHIIAVSGYNLSVLVRLVRRRLGALSLLQSTLVSAILVAGFISLAGNSASVIRAAWVIALSLATYYYGLNIRPLALLFVSAALTVFFDPFYIWYDLGWWLSFLAFYGVLVIGPALTRRIYRNSKPSFFPQIIIETFSATLCTLPISAWSFGMVSVYSLFANMVVVPIVPLLMVSGILILAGRFALGGYWLIGVLSYLAGLGLNIIFITAKFVASLPSAQLEIKLNTKTMFLSYCAIACLGMWLNSSRQSSTASYNLLE